MKKYKIEFLPSAWREIDEISSYYLNKVGPKSAKKIFDRILKAVERLEIFPLSCPLINDEALIFTTTMMEQKRLLVLLG